MHCPIPDVSKVATGSVICQVNTTNLILDCSQCIVREHSFKFEPACTAKVIPTHYNCIVIVFTRHSQWFLLV